MELSPPDLGSAGVRKDKKNEPQQEGLSHSTQRDLGPLETTAGPWKNVILFDVISLNLDEMP